MLIPIWLCIDHYGKLTSYAEPLRINHAAENCFCRISSITIDNLDDGVRICFHAEFGTGGRKRRQQKFMDTLTADPAIRSLKAVVEPVIV